MSTSSSGLGFEMKSPNTEVWCKNVDSMVGSRRHGNKPSDAEEYLVTIIKINPPNMMISLTQNP
jgi:hypothetical protein